MLACLGITGLMWLAAGITAGAQTPVSQLNPEQRNGRRLFYQNCALCHLARPDNVKSSEEGKAFGGDLKQLFKSPSPRNEQAVQAFVQQGLPKKMPGFRYSLKPEEINNIISYLKTL